MEPDESAQEAARLKALLSYSVLDTMAERAFDDLTRVAAYVAQTPIALISLVDAERQWFKSNLGLSVSETPRSVSFCTHAIRDVSQLMVVPDAQADPRFAANPLVTGEPHIRFYCGAPLVNSGNQALGTLCVIDRAPRTLSAEQLDALAALSRQAMVLLELRKYTENIHQIGENQNAILAKMQAFRHEMSASFGGLAPPPPAPSRTPKLRLVVSQEDDA